MRVIRTIDVCYQETCSPHPGEQRACYCFKSNDTQTECRPTMDQCEKDAAARK